jgi:Membrane-associated sensor, integral membrane domain/GAF domain
MALERDGDPAVFLATLPAQRSHLGDALFTALVLFTVFCATAPFAQLQLEPVMGFIPVYESALVATDLITAVLLFGQISMRRSAGLPFLAAAYLFTALLAIAHLLSFPGLFSPTGLLGAGPQTTAWLYMFWHAGFPLLVIVYARFEGAPDSVEGAPRRASLSIRGTVALVVALACAATLLATAGQSALPEIMQGNRYTPAMVLVVSTVWILSVVALLVLWRKRPRTVLDVWLMVVMLAWIFDIALSAVLNAGRFDLGFYAGRIYGLAASSLVLLVLLIENGRLHRRLADLHAKSVKRLALLRAIDRGIAAKESAEAIASAAIRPLRELLGVARAAVSIIDLAAGEAEWLAAAGRRRTHVGPGVRFSIRLMGDPAALARGESQIVHTRELPPGPEIDALLASGVQAYMVLPIIAGGRLIGALSFGGERAQLPAEQMNIAREVATQLAIALGQAQPQAGPAP